MFQAQIPGLVDQKLLPTTTLSQGLLLWPTTITYRCIPSTLGEANRNLALQMLHNLLLPDRHPLALLLLSSGTSACCLCSLHSMTVFGVSYMRLSCPLAVDWMVGFGWDRDWFQMRTAGHGHAVPQLPWRLWVTAVAAMDLGNNVQSAGRGGV